MLFCDNEVGLLWGYIRKQIRLEDVEDWEGNLKSNIHIWCFNGNIFEFYFGDISSSNNRNENGHNCRF